MDSRNRDRDASRRRTSRVLFAVLATALVLVSSFGAFTAAQNKVKVLPNADSSNYMDFDQITKANVKDLQLAWHYPYGAERFSPIFANGVLYGLGRNAQAIVALDPATGKEIWVHDGMTGMTAKGMNYWESEDGKDKRLIFSINSFLQEIDATTGKSIQNFGTDGYVDLRVGLPRAEGTAVGAQPASPGRIWKNTIIFGGQSGESIMTPAGDIRAYDIPTGKLLWQFHTVPRPGEFGYETNPADGYKYIGGANNWGEMSIDTERGIVYIPTGSATADFWGGDRHGTNFFANCLLALDVRTGKRLWHFQTVHHDLWDLDNVSAPQLVTVRHNGQRVDVVAHAGKTGFLYVFNRVTGEPLWPIEERPVGKSNVPNELSWSTQPFPTKPPAFARQSFTEDDVNPYLLTKEEYDSLKERVRKANNGTGPQGGIFVPTLLNGDAIGMPGNQGGSNWGTTAADPQRGLVFVTGVNQLALLHVNDVKDPAAAGRQGGGGGNQADGNQLTRGRQVFANYCAACHGADQRGAIPGVPSLVGVTDRIDEEGVRIIVAEGRNNMRPIVDATNEDVRAIYAYLQSTNPSGRGGSNAAGGRGRGGGPPLPPPANLVETGGVKTPPLPARYGGPLYGIGNGGTAGNMPWPEDVEAAKLPTRYQTGYNVMATSTKPPYTTITAYDLNTGDIKWQVPNGDDPATVDATTMRNGACPPLRTATATTPAPAPAAGGCSPEGVHNTGGVGARNGMIVTKTGLLFQLGKDGWARAYDVDNGQVLWKGKTAGQSIGIPAMYEYKGRQYVLFMSPAVAPGGAGGRQGGGTSAAPEAPTGSYGYIVFALPETK
jgi:quinoprotein glucose dehydrogenase